LRRLPLRVSLIALAFAASPALAQDQPPATAQADDSAQAEPVDDNPAPADNEIVVIAERLRGQVETDAPPIIELDPEQIASYGASSIADLVAQLAPEVGSGRGRGGGRPVFLVNGQRVSNFREFSRYPPEAIRKVEVLPESVALKYGFPPDQRVMNFILKDNYASRTVDARLGAPTRGGTATEALEASQLTIDGPNRLNLGAELDNTSLLTEAERGVIQAPVSVSGVAGDPDNADFRSLVTRSRKGEVDATWTHGLGEMGAGGQLTLNGQASREDRLSLSGLDTVLLTDPAGDSVLRAIDDDPLARRTRVDTLALGSAYNRPLGEWQLSATLDASRTRTETEIDRRRDTSALQAAALSGALAIDGPLPPVAGGGLDRAQSTVWSADSKATLTGHPILLPGGEVSVTFDTGYDWDRIDSDDSRTALGQVELTRGNLNAGVNVGIPISSTREGFLEAIGDLSLNVGGGIDHLSDFGTLTNWTTGFTWKPTDRLTFQGSSINRQVAPGLDQLGGPQIVDFNVPVYDFSTGSTVLATVTTGGNPNLVAESQHDLKLSATYDLKLFDRSNFLVEYFHNRSNNVTAGFPLLTPEIEAAFPGRVTRVGGTLVAIDRRPVTFAEETSSRIRYGFNVFGRLGKKSDEAQGGGRSRAPAAPIPAAAEVPPATAPTTPGTGRDPARYAQMRQQLCATDGAAIDPSTLPERIQERLRGADGQIDPAKLAELRTRMCAAPAAGTTPGQSGQRTFDPARMEAMRQALCAPGDNPDLSALPERLVERLKGPDGNIDPAKLAEARARMCAAQPGAGAAAAGQPQPTPVQVAAAPAATTPGLPGGFGRGRGRGGGRWNLSLYHTIELSNRVTIAQGGPVLDLLEGDALADGGVSRHKIELEGGLFLGGIGARVSADYLSGTTVRGSGLPGSSDLRFGSLATFNLRLFADLEQQGWLTGGTPGFWKGARLSLKVNNLFDAHQRVTDDNGVVPLRYQPGLIDPVGRYVELEFRKMF
jgi:hypothetical protein